jgi:hypothetical protein
LPNAWPPVRADVVKTGFVHFVVAPPSLPLLPEVLEDDELLEPPLDDDALDDVLEPPLDDDVLPAPLEALEPAPLEAPLSDEIPPPSAFPQPTRTKAIAR